MNTDFRVSVGFFNHPKTLKLQSRLGLEGIYSLLRLWAFTAQFKPKGVLTNMTIEDVELASEWKGEQGKLVDTLNEIGFLDIDPGSNFEIHDWEQHNHWAFYSNERSEHARMMAEKRWKDRKEKEEQKAMLQAMPQAESVDCGSSDAVSNASSNAGSNTDSSADGNAPFLSSPTLTSPDLSSPSEDEPSPLSSPLEGGKRRAEKKHDPSRGESPSESASMKEPTSAKEAREKFEELIGETTEKLGL